MVLFNSKLIKKKSESMFIVLLRDSNVKIFTIKLKRICVCICDFCLNLKKKSVLFKVVSNGSFF